MFPHTGRTLRRAQRFRYEDAASKPFSGRRVQHARGCAPLFRPAILYALSSLLPIPMRRPGLLTACLLLLMLAACAERETPPPPENVGVATGVDAAVERFPVRRNGQWGYIDRGGELVIAPIFDQAWTFSDGLALVRREGRYGYIDTTGALVIEPQYADAWHFSEGLAPVQVGDQWGYIDRNGEMVIDPQFNLAPSLLEVETNRTVELHPVRADTGYGYQRDGDFVIAPRFDRAWYFENGLARVQVGDQWGYIDREGRFAITPRFDRAWDFENGLALVEVDGRLGYIDPSGRYVWEPSE